MVDVLAWVASSLVLEVQKDLLLDWRETLEVQKAASSEALVSSVVHSLQVSDVAGDNITLTVVHIVLRVVHGLNS